MRQAIFTRLLLVLALLIIPAIIIPAVSASVVSVTTPIVSGTYGAGSRIPIVLTYNDSVTVQGSPVLQTSLGNASLINVSGVNVTFAYVIGAADTGALSVLSLDTTNGNVSDANLSLPASSLGITANGALNSSSTIVFSIPAVSNQSNVTLTASFGSPAIVSSSTVLVGPNGNVPSACVNCTLSLADGTYTLTVSAQNVIGLSSNATTQFRVDTTAPTINWIKLYVPNETAVSAGWVINMTTQLANISVNASANVTIMLNGVSLVSNSSITQLNLSPGLNQISIVANDGIWTTTQSFNVSVTQPFSVASLASALSAHGITMSAYVNGLDVTGHESLNVPAMNVTLSVANVTYLLTNVNIPNIAPSAASSVAVQTSDSNLLNLANASTLYFVRNLAGIKSVFTQYTSLAILIAYNYSSTNVTVLSFDVSDSNITRPALNLASGNASFNATGFGVAVGEDGIAPTIVNLSVASVADTSAVVTIATNEPATCRMTTRAGLYANMSNYVQFSVAPEYTLTNVTLSGLTAGTGYTYYTACNDSYGNVMNTTQTIAFTTSGTTPTQTSSGSTTSGTSSSSSSNTQSLSSSQRSIIDSMGRDDSLYVDLRQIDWTSSDGVASTDVSQLLNSTSRVNGKLVDADVRTTATAYELLRADGTSDVVTKITTRISFNDTPDRFDVIQVIPKSIARNSGRLSGSYSVLENDPVIVFSRRSSDASSDEVTVTYAVSGSKLNAADLIQTYVADRSAAAPSESSGSTTKPVTTPTVAKAANAISAWKIAGYIAVALLALLGIVWFIGKYLSSTGGNGGFGGSFGRKVHSDGPLFREKFSHHDD